MRRILPTMLVAAMVAAAALPAAALGATRYAAPAGGSAAGCPTAEPCSLRVAIEGAQESDEVIVTPGDYEVAAQIETPAALTIHGEAGQPRPRIVGALHVTPLVSFHRVSISDLAIEATEASSGLGVLDITVNESVLERLELIGRGAPTEAALLGPSEFSLTDSLLLLLEAPSRRALEIRGSSGAEGVQLRNDTIVATGTGTVGVEASGPFFSPLTVNATNLIVEGASVDAKGLPFKNEGVVAFDHSNFDTSSGNVTATDSQTAPPAFVDAAAGNYQEALGSPTIDAGVNAEADGATDLLGNPRALPGFLTCGAPPPAVTDIGAYEFVPSQPPCPPNEGTPSGGGGGGTGASGPPASGPQATGPPATGPRPMSPPPPPGAKARITSVNIHGRRATFRFRAAGPRSRPRASRFSCKLDREAWRRCRSPKTYRNLRPGRHVFRVRPTRNHARGATAKRKFRIFGR